MPEVQQRRAFFGTEATLGAGGTPTFREFLDIAINKARPLADIEEFPGNYFPDQTVVYGPITVDGTATGPLTFEDLAIRPRYAVEAAPAGVSDGAVPGPPAFTYAYRPDSDVLTRETAVVELGTPEANNRWLATGVHWGEFTISADIDDAQASWRWASTLLALNKVPLVAAFTALGSRTRETIDGPGTQVFIDPHDGGTIGTTDESDRVISWSATYPFNSAGKRFMSDLDGFSRFGKGATRATGQLVMEFDSRAEYDAWEAKAERKLRFRRVGSEIHPAQTGPPVTPQTFKRATLDFFRVAFDTPTFGERATNITVTIPWRAYEDPTEATLYEIEAVVDLAVLP